MFFLVHSSLYKQTLDPPSAAPRLAFFLSVVALLWRTPCRLVVGYRPFLIYSREEGASPVGTCSGRCNQSRTVQKRLRGFVLGLGHRPCSFGRGDDTEPKFVLTRESVCWK